MAVALDDAKRDKRLIDALNAHGIFFKKKVRQTIELLPNLRILGEEYPVSYGKGTAIDLLVAALVPAVFSNLIEFIIPIECKRAITDRKMWVFFKDPSNEVKLIYYFKEKECVPVSLPSHRLGQLPICLEGVEIDMTRLESTQDANWYKAASLDRIFETANQVCRGSLGFLYQELNTRRKSQDSTLRTVVVFPMVVTTAPLFVCEPKLEAIDLKTGKHGESAPAMTECPCLILSHPFAPTLEPEEQRPGTAPSGYLAPSDRPLQYKEGILILNATHLPEFFDMSNSNSALRKICHSLTS